MGSLVNGSVLFCAGALCIASSMCGSRRHSITFRRCTGALLLVFTAAFFDDGD